MPACTIASSAVAVAACGGGTEYQTADAVKAFNADQDNAKYGIALACDLALQDLVAMLSGTPAKLAGVIMNDY